MGVSDIRQQFNNTIDMATTLPDLIGLVVMIWATLICSFTVYVFYIGIQRNLKRVHLLTYIFSIHSILFVLWYICGPSMMTLGWWLQAFALCMLPIFEL